MYNSLMMSWMLVLGITVISFANGQTVPPCARRLSPCIDFMNSTNPPQTCCDPVKEVNTTQKTCFCQVALSPGMLEGIGITTAQAVQLLQSCGVDFKITNCEAYSSAPPPSSVQPPAMAGGDKRGTSRATFPGLSFILFLCVYVLFN